MKSDSKSGEHQDDIQSILGHSGVVSPYLERMRQISSDMKELEWKLMKRAAASAVRPPVASSD